MPFTNSTKATSVAQKPEETDAEFEARFNAALAASPEARAAWEEFQRTQAAFGERLTSALRRASFGGEMNLRLLMKAWQGMGFEVKDFTRGDLGILIRLLEARADALEQMRKLDQIRGHENPPSPLLMKKKGILGGRADGQQVGPIDGKTLREWRGNRSMNAIADLIGIDADTLRRAENEERVSKHTRQKISKYIQKNKPKKPQ